MPLPVIHTDIETKSHTSVKLLGAWAYSLAETTDVWCVCWRIDGDEGVVNIWEPGDPIPEPFRQPHIVAAHNYRFEQAIVTNILHARYGWPLPVTYQCTMALAYRYNLPGALDSLASRLGVAEKDAEGKKLMIKMHNRKTYDPSKAGSQAWRDHMENRVHLIQYCQQDVVAESEVYRWFGIRGRQYDMQEFELDKRINDRGIRVDRMTASAVYDCVTQEAEELHNQIPKLTDGAAQKATQVKELSTWLQTQGYQGTSLAADLIKHQLESPGNLTQAAREVLAIRQKISLGSIAKFDVMVRTTTADDDRMRGLFQLYGASQTGRYAGRLVQFQNLPRMSFSDAEIEAAIYLFRCGDRHMIKQLFGDLFATAKQLIRPMFFGEPGLVVSDLSQIECRTVAWLADCKPMLDILSDASRDPYSEMAATIFDQPVSQFGKGTDGRQLGKCAMLGLGFGMGADTFQSTVKNWTGMTIEPEEAQRIVSIFRSTFRPVQKFWRKLEDAFRSAIENFWLYPDGGMPEVTVGKLQVWGEAENDEVIIRLPSGRTLHYPGSHLKPRTKDEYEELTFLNGKSERTKTYSGKLCENVTQATARDVMLDGMLRLDKVGFHLLGSVHDEVLIEGAEASAVEQIDDIMSTCPPWAKGLPLAAETGFARRYTK